MILGYLGRDNKAEKIKAAYIGINNKARKIVKAYVGVDGVAELAYPRGVAIPTVSGAYTYNTTVQEAVISNCDTDDVAISGTTKTADAGTYTVTFTLKSPYYKWTDGTAEPKTGTWSIAPKAVSKPHTTGTYTYSGSKQYVTYSSFDSNEINVTGETYATTAGTHTVYYNLKNPTGFTNYIWESDSSTTPKSDTWTIAKKSLAVPTVTGTYTYNGSTQTATLSGFNSNLMTKSGDSKVGPGTFTITFGLKDSNNYKWATTPATAKWVIGKGTPSISIEIWMDTSDFPYSKVTTIKQHTSNSNQLVPIHAVNTVVDGGSYPRGDGIKDLATSDFEYKGGYYQYDVYYWTFPTGEYHIYNVNTGTVKLTTEETSLYKQSTFSKSYGVM